MANVRCIVDDVDRAIAFYETLGFALVERWGPPFAMVGRGDLTLWLSGPASSAGKPLPDGARPAPGGWLRIVIEVDDLDATIAKHTTAGTRFRTKPIAGPGGRQVLIEDPSGNPVELFEARK
jgi:catechol 2,3-dioxygenase-like lactoylglutathione lyase family enzyme